MDEARAYFFHFDDPHSDDSTVQFLSNKDERIRTTRRLLAFAMFDALKSKKRLKDLPPNHPQELELFHLPRMPAPNTIIDRSSAMRTTRSNSARARAGSSETAGYTVGMDIQLRALEEWEISNEQLPSSNAMDLLAFNFSGSAFEAASSSTISHISPSAAATSYSSVGTLHSFTILKVLKPGRTWLVVNKDSERQVIKLYSKAEYIALEALKDCDVTPKLFGAFQHGQLRLILMEYLPYPSLEEEPVPALASSSLDTLVRRAHAALEQVHARGVSLYDIRPANTLVVNHWARDANLVGFRFVDSEHAAVGAKES